MEKNKVHELRHARAYRSNLINLRYALENAHELALCCGQMGAEVAGKLEEMVSETRDKVASITRMLAYAKMEEDKDEDA